MHVCAHCPQTARLVTAVLPAVLQAGMACVEAVEVLGASSRSLKDKLAGWACWGRPTGPEGPATDDDVLEAGEQLQYYEGLDGEDSSGGEESGGLSEAGTVEPSGAHSEMHVDGTVGDGGDERTTNGRV